MNIKESNISNMSPNVINSNRLYQMYWKKKNSFQKKTVTSCGSFCFLFFFEGIMVVSKYSRKTRLKSQKPPSFQGKQAKPPASPLKTPEILPTEVVDARVKPLGANVGASVAGIKWKGMPSQGWPIRTCDTTLL